MTEKHDYVTSGELAAKLETVDAKLSSLRAWMVAAFLGGQALAGLVAALITRTTPMDVSRAAAALFAQLI